MFDFKEEVYFVYNDGTIRGQCPKCQKAQLVYLSDNSTSVRCQKCEFISDWVSFSETLEVPKLVWVFDGKEQYLKVLPKDLLFINGTCVLDDERGHEGTWTPM